MHSRAFAHLRSEISPVEDRNSTFSSNNCMPSRSTMHSPTDVLFLFEEREADLRLEAPLVDDRSDTFAACNAVP